MSSSESELSEASEPPSSEEEYEEESQADAESESDEDEGGASGSEEGAAADGSDGDGAGGDAAAADAAAGEEEEDVEPTQAALEERRQQNIKALVSGAGLNCRRAALMPRLLTVQQAAVVLRRPFRPPLPNAPAVSESLKRKLAARKAFVPWGGGKFVPLKLKVPLKEPLPILEEPSGTAGTAAAAAAEPAVVLPPGVEPLVLWEPPAGVEGQPVRVDDMLTQFLRPHQREGVAFMFECVCGLRKFDGQGCILADDMGLGKTLQGISLLWTLLSSKGHPLLGGEPIAKRVIICCPTSLVGNWDSECQKWLKGRVRTLPLCESSRDEALASISQFLSPRNPYQVMIVSYETFRLHAERFTAPGTCDLLICDEAHRLKNDATLTNRALDSLACRRRVLLSGTPLQNRLDEFYAMVSFCNPGVLGSPAQFRRHFEAPILAGREPDASEEEVQLCQERTAELSALVNEFILRRTNTLLSEHLPPKVVEIVCCKLTPLQLALYCHFLESKATRSLFATQKSAKVLSAITSLRKLLNHPKLIWDALNSNAHGKEGSREAEGFEGCTAIFPPGIFGGGRHGRGGGVPPGWELLSGKFAVLAGMLELLRTCTRDRIVVVSNYTQTLDLVSQLCRDRGYPFVRLDGSTTIKKRNKLVKDFNDPNQNQFAFLLSSKAGGCGLNLIGGNRLVLFDPSWNPADDKQAAARVWRDGQKKKVYVYRFMATGTIEEKVYQRQLSKEGLQQVVDTKAGGKPAGPNLMSMDELRDLFSYDPDTLSTTYDSMCCARPEKPPKAAAASKGGKGRGGKQAAAAGQRRGRPAGGGGAARKRQKRRNEWSDSSSEEEEEEEVFSDEEEEEVVILDSEDEEEQQQRIQQQQRAQPPASGGRAQRVVEDSEGEGWSSDECGASPAGGAAAVDSPLPPTQPHEEAAEERQQGQAQPLPPPQQQGEAAAAAGGDHAPAAAVAAAVAAEQQQQHCVPTGVLKRTGATLHKEQVGKPGEEQLKLWGHHSSTATVPDQVMQQIGDEWVSFVFSLQVDGRPVDPEPPLAPLAQQPGGTGTAGHARRAGGVRPAMPAGALAGVKRPAAAAVAAPHQTAAAAAATTTHAAPMPPAPAPASKENAGSNAAVAAGQRVGSRLALPQRPKPVAAAAAAAKPAPRAAVIISDSEDDFK